MDKRTRVLKPVAVRTVVMQTPPKMTAIMEAVSRQESDRPALGVTRMPTPPSEDELNTDKTSLFVRRPPQIAELERGHGNLSVTTARPIAAPSNMATRMVFSNDNPGALAPPPKKNNRQPRLPMPPSGGFVAKKRSGTKEIAPGVRILKPIIAVAVLAVVAVAVLSQRSESIAVAAGTVDSSQTSSVPDEQSLPLNVIAQAPPESKPKAAPPESKPSVGPPESKPTVAVREAKSEAPAMRQALAKSIESSDTAVPASGNESESDAASLLLSGHRREALAIYQRLASRPNSSSGVQAMRIVLQQKVEMP